MSGWDNDAAAGGTAGNQEWSSGATDRKWNTSGNSGVSGVDAVNAGDMNGGLGEAAGCPSNDEAGNDTCRNCGQSGHFARDCTEPKKIGACFNCGEDGHSKADCTKPRVFKGICNSCGEEVRDCPTKPKVCKNCLQEGHKALNCKNKKAVDNSNVADKTEVEAWEMLKDASDDKDLDDFKEAMKILNKAVPEYTYQQLETEFRKRGYKVYTIALEKEIGDTWTNVDLQGEIGKKYAIGYYFSEKPQRPNLASKWPAWPEENMERLADAGVPMDRGVEKCNNCGELGHVLRDCTQDLIPIEHATVTCALCGEQGHRVRDCTQERQKPREPRACKICEETDHIAKDCPKREKRACRKCNSEDHMAKECDIIKCNNCDAIGHESRDCSAPKNWSRVKCRNCGEMGHGLKRCKLPIKEDEAAAGGGGNENLGFDAAEAAVTGGGNGWDEGAATTGCSGNNEWENAAPTPIAAGDGGLW